MKITKLLKQLKEDKYLFEHPQELIYVNGQLIVSRCDNLFYAKFRRTFKKKLLYKCIFLDLKFVLKAIFVISFIFIPRFIVFLPFEIILGALSGINAALIKAIEK